MWLEFSRCYPIGNVAQGSFAVDFLLLAWLLSLVARQMPVGRLQCFMTHEQLIALARKRAEDFNGVNEENVVTLKMLPKVRVREAVVVYFEGDEHDGHTEICLDKDSGEFISGTMSPRKAKGGA